MVSFDGPHTWKEMIMSFQMLANNHCVLLLTLSTPHTSIKRTFANSADPDDPAGNQPSHQDLHCLLIVFKFEQNTLSEEWNSLKI